MNQQASEAEILSRKASVARSRLADTVDRPDRQRPDLPEVRWPALAAIAGGAIVVLGTGVSLAIRHVARRPQRRGMVVENPTLWRELGRRVLVGVAAPVATELARRAVRALALHYEQRAAAT